MTTVLAVVIGSSVLAFFGRFFLALCRELSRYRKDNTVEMIDRREDRRRLSIPDSPAKSA
jgi:hypothetical protein